jgi:hypothetical protein
MDRHISQNRGTNIPFARNCVKKTGFVMCWDAVIVWDGYGSLQTVSAIQGEKNTRLML